MDIKPWKKQKRTGGIKRKLKKAYSQRELTEQNIILQGHGQPNSKLVSPPCNECSVESKLLDHDEIANICAEDMYVGLVTCGEGSVQAESGIMDQSMDNYSEIVESESSSDEDEANLNLLFRNNIKKWAIDKNISQSALKKLIQIINARFPDLLPQDPRTILRTTTEVNIKSIEIDCEYWHNGLLHQLITLFDNMLDIPDILSLIINFDGLPIYKSSKNEFWPILCAIYEYPDLHPFVIGIYYGSGKPKNLDKYLEDFVIEMRTLLEDGIQHGLKKIRIKIRCFVCDSPARAFIKDEVPTKRKFQQAPDQYAVDDHGRRRFHGAFTGGFSAGFGNTVGSQEGWTPTAFKSSRSEKAMLSSQRPEDFMDEEDRGEFGIAPRLVQTHKEFSGQKRSHRTQYHDGPIPGEPVLQQLVRAVHETAAVRMLRAMGWKEGQGTGERLSRKDKRKAKDQHKVYGCFMPPELRKAQEEEIEPQDEDEDSSDSEVDFDTLFAPDDYEPYILQRKNDRFGLGYSGLSRHSVLGNLVGEYGSEAGTSRSHLVMKDKGKRVSIRGQAFGVGAFEADDDDIYATEDMSHYDFTIGEPAPKKEAKKAKDRSGHVLPGFVKATKPLPPVPAYPAPALPRDYVPAAAGARRTRFEPTTHQPRDQGLGRHELSAKARGELLGEVPLPTPTNTPLTAPITDTPQTDNQDPIAKLIGKSINFVSNTENKELDYIPIKDSGKELTKVFKPFLGNPEKQSRYERYLENRDSRLEKDSGMDKLKEWERERELVEFEQAAKLYKPLSGIMGDRFTHASEPDDAVNPLTAVAKSSINHGLATLEQREAAEKGVYGVMTRRETPWRPEALVCKRFNVPELGARIEQKKEDKPKASYSIFSYLESSVHDKDSFAKEQSKFSGSKSLTTNILPKTDNKSKDDIKLVLETPKAVDQTAKEIISNKSIKDQPTGFTKRMTVAEMFLKESEKSKAQGTEVTDTINQFDKMDLYKSIFLSDSEEEVENDNESNNSKMIDFIDVPKNVERNTSPPRGIFANIDFDELNSWRRKDETNKNPKESAKELHNSTKTDDSKNSKVDEEMYGPKIPENLQKRLQTDVLRDLKESIEIESSTSEDSWVDVNEVQKKSKKDKKKKKKKHKSKHKKKSKSKKN